MDTGKSRLPSLTVLIAAIALLVGCGTGIMLGGVAGYVIGQRTANRVSARFERVIPAPFGPGPRLTPRALQTPEAGPSQGTPGVVVQEVVAGSPAESAGLRAGDVITQMDNVRLDANHLLSDLVAEHKPGDQVTFTLLRSGQSQTITVTLGERVDNSEAAYLGVRYADAATGP